MQKEITVQYEGFLTQDKLKDILCNQLKNVLKVSEQETIPETRYKVDFVIYLDNGTRYMVEFDGNFHYTKAKNFDRDSIKEAIWDIKYGNKKVIRIPYFVQLTTQTFQLYFKPILDILNLKVNVIQNYAHGFIDKKAILPADFCTVGERRFIYEMTNLPENVQKDIISSLHNLMKIKPDHCVISLNLRQIDIFKEIIDWKEYQEGFIKTFFMF